jgi:acetyltransferase-like isoleucine patch superfamily enzyme
MNTIRKFVGKVLRRIKVLKEAELSKRYPQYSFGRGTYGNLTVKNWGTSDSLKVGAYTSIAGGVTVFLGSDHRTDWVTTYPFSVFLPSVGPIDGYPRSKGDVIIGNDVWIGADALILSGVNIGDGAVVGARAVVTRDVPPYAIALGMPAKVIRYRFTEAVIAELLRIKWWEWPEGRIEKAVPDMLSEKIELFIEKANKELYK